jgi:hypothetical protein
MGIASARGIMKERASEAVGGMVEGTSNDRAGCEPT